MLRWLSVLWVFCADESRVFAVRLDPRGLSGFALVCSCCLFSSRPLVLYVRRRLRLLESVALMVSPSGLPSGIVFFRSFATSSVWILACWSSRFASVSSYSPQWGGVETLSSCVLRLETLSPPRRKEMSSCDAYAVRTVDLNGSLRGEQVGTAVNVSSNSGLWLQRGRFDCQSVRGCARWMTRSAKGRVRISSGAETVLCRTGSFCLSPERRACCHI